MTRVLIQNIIGAFAIALITLQMGQPASANTINFNSADVDTRWAQYKSNYISGVEAGPAPRQRVYGGVTETTTVSEGQAYGMLFAVNFDEQTLFDGLWLFAADHLDETGLMHWYIGERFEIIGFGGAATDADLDMTMAMIKACAKVRSGEWNPSNYSLDYCAIALELIDIIWRTEIDDPGFGPPSGLDFNVGYELLPGNRWYLKDDYTDGLINLSYFSPAYFRIFAEFSNNPKWYTVIDRNYDIAMAVQDQPGNCSYLVHNWSKWDGRPQEVEFYVNEEEYWGYDATRYAWRIANDAVWFNDSTSINQMNLIGGFFSSVGINYVGEEYRLDGTVVNDEFQVPLFVSTAATAIWAAPNPIATGCGDAQWWLQTNPQQAYDATVGANYPENYFNDSWVLLSLMLMQGRFEKPDLALLNTPPTLAAVAPANSAAGINPNTDLQLTFSEVVFPGTGHIIISEAGGAEVERIDVTSDRISINDAVVTVDPATLLDFGSTFAVTIEAGTFVDRVGGAYAGLGVD